MTKRLTNAQTGFFVGSLLYYLFLSLAVLAEHGRWFRSSSPVPGTSFTVLCNLGYSSSFWYRTVSSASLSHRLQPHVLYLCALTFAGFFYRLPEAIRQDREPTPRRRVVTCWLFGSIVLLNLWFSSANLLPRYVRG